MGGRVHDPDARLALGHGWVADSHGEHPFLEQSAAELLRQWRFAQHHRHDGRLAIAGVEAHRLHLAPEEVSVRPEPVDELGRFAQDGHSLDAGRCVGRGHGAAEEERPPALPQPLDDDRLAGHQPADDPERLAQRAHFHVYPTMQPEVIDDTPPAAAEHPLAVGVIDHQHDAVLLGHIAGRCRRPC